MAGIESSDISLDDSELCSIRHTQILNESFTEACGLHVENFKSVFVGWEKEGGTTDVNLELSSDSEFVRKTVVNPKNEEVCAHLYENPMTAEDAGTELRNIIKNNKLPSIVNATGNHLNSYCIKDISNRSLPAPADISDGIPLCRICHEDNGDEDLVSPCFCSGSVGLLHVSCLEKWLGSSNTTTCEICQYQFSLAKRPRPYKWFLTNKRFGKAWRKITGDFVCMLGYLLSVISGGVGANFVEQKSAKTGLLFLATFSLCIFTFLLGLTIWRLCKKCRLWRRNYHTIKILYTSTSENETSINSQSRTIATEVTEIEPEPRVSCTVKPDKNNNGKTQFEVIHTTPWPRRKGQRPSTPKNHSSEKYQTSTPQDNPLRKEGMKLAFSGCHGDSTPISADVQSNQPFPHSDSFPIIDTNCRR